MDDEHKANDADNETPFSRQVREQAARKLKARRSPTGVWFGLGMMGVIGWSVAIPTVLGAVIGIWLDERYSSRHSWTLALLVAGLSNRLSECVGGWVAKEVKAMSEDNNDE